MSSIFPKVRRGWWIGVWPGMTMSSCTMATTCGRKTVALEQLVARPLFTFCRVLLCTGLLVGCPWECIIDLQSYYDRTGLLWSRLL